MKTTLFARRRSLFFLCLVMILGVYAPSDVYAQFTLGNVFKRKFTKAPSELFRNTPQTLETIYVCYRVFDASVADCGFTHKAIGLKQPADDPENNGGHSHNGDRPFGELKFNGVEAPADVGIKGQTEHKAVTVNHRMPQAAGKMIVERIITTSPGSLCGHDCFTLTSWKFEETIDVGIPGLKQLRDPTPTDFYRKVRKGPFGTGTDAVHRDFVAYAGSPATLGTLPLIAVNYFVLSFGRLLSVNDISLPKGGVFETSFLNPQWKPPHIDHRDGNDVDINRRDPITGELLGTCKGDRALRLAADQVLFPSKRKDGELSALLCESGERRHLDIKVTVE